MGKSLGKRKPKNSEPGFIAARRGRVWESAGTATRCYLPIGRARSAGCHALEPTLLVESGRLDNY